MSDASPPVWIRRLAKTDSGLDAAHKFMLQVLWAFGPYANKRGTVLDRPDLDDEVCPSKPVTVFPCRETLMAETGQPLGTVKSQIRRLVDRGWIRREKGSMVTLAWRAPGSFSGVVADTEATRPPRQPVDTEATAAEPEASPVDTESHRPTRRPLTFQGTSNSTSSDLAAAHTTPSESTTPDGNTQDYNHRHPRGHEPGQPGQRGRGAEPRSQRTRPEPEPPGLDASGDRSVADHAHNPPRRDVAGPAGLQHRGQRGPGPRQLDTPASEAHRGTRELRARVGDGLSSAYPEHVQAKHDRVTQSSHVDPARKSNGSPGGGHNQLDGADFKLIEAHDGGRWAVSLMSDRWAESLAEAMADLNIDAARVCAVLDVWTDHTRDGVTTGIPARRELWWAGGKRGSIVARPWLLRALEATRPKLRVVSGESEYERAKAWAHR